MKIPFVQPRFEGARFGEHTLPVDVARDLAAYETLVIELAKHLYLQDHPERQRVLRGFAADFNLHLERVDDGSAKPLLAIVAAAALALDAGTNVYFERSRDLITECIGAPDGQLPEDFPRHLLSHFNQVGRSLRADERMELTTAGGNVATLTPERRKHLVLAAETVYEREVELSGTIEEADWERSTFRMRLPDGVRLVVPMPESFHPTARSYGGRYRHQVTMRGVGAYDSWDRLQKVVSVESLEIQADYELAGRLDELRSLTNGWLDGQGLAPDPQRLDQIAPKMIGHYPERLPLPAMVPTPEGNLLFEWNVPGEPSLDIRLEDLKAEFHVFRDGEDLEEVFDLATQDEWRRLFTLLTTHIQPA